MTLTVDPKAHTQQSGIPGSHKHTLSASGATSSLVTIPNVEILSTGTYEIASPGEITFTASDLAAAVAAQSDPYVHTPRLKIGHTTDFGDGEPSFGKVTGMRLSPDGQTIIGDYEGVPRWLAEIMPAAYPSRSIEGGQDVTTPDGKKHQMVIEAVALLGVVAPGVATLEDLAGFYGEQEPDGVELVAGQKITAKIGGDPMAVITATVEVEDVRRQYYEGLDAEQAWWWVRAVELDPNALIVDDDKGHLYRVPFDISGDAATFSDPVEVQIVYTPVDSNVAAKIAAGSGRQAATFASRAESRPESTEQEDQVELTEDQLTRLGLSADATQEDVDAKLAELTPDAPPEPENADTPDDTDAPETGTEDQTPPAETTEQAPTPALASVDPAALSQMQQDAALGREARQQQLDQERDALLDKAVAAGKFPPARKEHWRSLYDQDPEGVKETIGGLAAGLVPVDEKGTQPSDDGSGLNAAAYDPTWLAPGERKRIEAAHGGADGGATITTEAI